MFIENKRETEYNRINEEINFKEYWKKYSARAKPERLEQEYREWFIKSSHKRDDTMSLKEDLKEEMEKLSVMGVEEYTLYRKWLEIELWAKSNNLKKEDSLSSFFDGDSDDLTGGVTLESVKHNIWIPSEPNDYLKLEPVLQYADKPHHVAAWNMLRTFTSSMLNNSNIGRNLRFIVRDKITEKYLGVICVSSDFMDLTPRDNWIGWSKKVKTEQKMINHTAIGSTIVPVQPLGYDYLGGKLLALLTISEDIANTWEKEYGYKLAAVTTTSLYGSFSQYNSLKYWRKMGRSSGTLKYEPSKKMVHRIRYWLSQNFPLKYWEWYYGTNDRGLVLKRDHKQRSLSLAYKELGIDISKTQAAHERGIYFCPLYDKTREFLRKEVTVEHIGNKLFDNSTTGLVNLWKEKYAKKRLDALLKENRFSYDTLFYDELLYLSWEEVKAKYLKDVGR